MKKIWYAKSVPSLTDSILRVLNELSINGVEPVDIKIHHTGITGTTIYYYHEKELEV